MGSLLRATRQLDLTTTQRDSLSSILQSAPGPDHRRQMFFRQLLSQEGEQAVGVIDQHKGLHLMNSIGHT